VLDSTAELLKTRREVARCLTVARAKDLPAKAGKAKE
jgi:ribosomal protein L29